MAITILIIMTDSTCIKMQNLIQKYKPQKIEDLTTNIVAVKNLCIWLDCFDTNKSKALEQLRTKKTKKKGAKKILSVDEIENGESVTNKTKFKSTVIVTGKHGIGKTTMIDVILSQKGYTVIYMTLTMLKNGKDIEDTLNKLLNSNNILSVINKSKKEKLAVVFDGIGSVTSSTAKACITSLQKYNDINWYCPLIFVSNDKHHKLMVDIKKFALEIPLLPLMENDMKRILMRIIVGECMKVSSTCVDIIIEQSQGDMRRMILMVEDLKNIYGTCPITNSTMSKYNYSSNKKDINITLFDATDKILYDYKDIESCLRLYEAEKVLLPIMIHHNYPKSIKKTCDDKFKIIQDVTNFLSKGDVIENYIYGEQNWNMQEIHGLYTCAFPSFYLNGNTNKTSYSTFASDLNKTSLQKINNRKNIAIIDNFLENMNINDYIYLSSIIKQLILRNDIKECVSILKNYNIKFEHIETLLKIDKIKYEKINFTSKQKNEFLYHINN